ncbi:RidA family protein [Rhodococcus koreensis]
MTSTIESRLNKLGVELPTAAAPAASYRPYLQTGKLIFTSGQLPLKDGTLVATGLLGQDLDTAAGQHAAQWCAANVLAQAREATGDLDRIKQLLKITVFVASTPTFTDHHLVANTASALFLDALGASGTHARSAIGVAALPMNAPVEVEAVFEVR